MTGLDEQLAHQIECVLGLESLDGSRAGSDETLSQLFALANDCLTQAVPEQVRSAASELAALSGKVDGEVEQKFRAALENLRKVLASEKELAASANQFANDPELVQEFLVEARDHLVSVEAAILSLERAPDVVEPLHSVFRSFHTVKGLAGFLGASAIQELAHETENVLDLARSGQLAVSSELTDLILRSADELLRCLAAADTKPLNQLPRCNVELLASLAAFSRGEAGGTRAVVSNAAVLSNVAAASVQLPTAGEDQTSMVKAPSGNVIKVDALKLEYLVDMVGELVISESVVRHDPLIARSEDPVLSRNLAQLVRVVQEVQKTSMSMRMVAVTALFRKMNRLVRDLSRKSGKLVDLTTVGDEVELDRTIVEELADPMVHMIRNAVDHGLETPDERRKAGKDEQGTVRLSAMHDAGDIVIELSDDGRGMDPARILAKARKQGLVGDQDQLDEESILRLIFEPGFSTVEKVTDLSGRGVGMDVVKKQIQKLRGRVAIRSVLGKGTTFVLRLPLTLAIIDGLVVGVGSQRYILPMFAVREMFSPKPGTLVTLENRVEAALFREHLLPVIRLSRMFGMPESENSDGGVSDGGVLIVVEARDQLMCIAVDQLIGKQEVVIKSLGKTYRDVPAISGGAILGDGRVGLIIDVNALRYRN